MDTADSQRLAMEAQRQSDDAARQEPGLLSVPPDGLPSLQPILGEVGEPFGSAEVVGYCVGPLETVNEYAFKGKPLRSGDVGFYEMISTKLVYGRLLPGVTMTIRQARFVYARVVGNPVLLESQAKRIGYQGAITTSPGWLKLGEVSEAQ